MNSQTRPQFSGRALTSTCAAVSFLAMVISGVAMFLAPSTRIAREINWQMWGLSKAAWQDLHLVFSALFLIVALIHTVYNWRPMVNYLKARAAKHRGIRWEWPAALVLGALMWVGTRREMAPFSWLLDWRERFHGGQCETSPAPDHAVAQRKGGFGQKTLAQYCTEQGVNLDAAIARLQANGIKASKSDTLRQLADNNGRERPSEIIRLLQQP
jgi:hypothetical protein